MLIVGRRLSEWTCYGSTVVPVRSASRAGDRRLVAARPSRQLTSCSKRGNVGVTWPLVSISSCRDPCNS